MEALSPYEQIATQVCDLDRADLIRQLTQFEGPFPLDFSREYLAGISTEKMRHLLAAALWRAHRAGAASMASGR